MLGLVGPTVAPGHQRIVLCSFLTGYRRFLRSTASSEHSRFSSPKKAMRLYEALRAVMYLLFAFFFQGYYSTELSGSMDSGGFRRE